MSADFESFACGFQSLCSRVCLGLTSDPTSLACRLFHWPPLSTFYLYLEIIAWVNIQQLPRRYCGKNTTTTPMSKVLHVYFQFPKESTSFYSRTLTVHPKLTTQLQVDPGMHHNMQNNFMATSFLLFHLFRKQTGLKPFVLT